MNPLVAHIAAGTSFFSGIVVLLTSVFLRRRTQRRISTAIANVGIVFGALLIALSSIPMAWWLWGLAAATVLVSTLLPVPTEPDRRRLRGFCNGLMIVVWGGVFVLEAGWYITPQIPESGAEKLPEIVVLADSLTAGLGEGEAVTWPQRLRERYQIPVMDLSHVGETAASALERARSHQLPESAVVIIEIGGNDLLGSTSVTKFRRDLGELLEFASGPQRTVFLFALPLPPLHAEWARVYRDVAQTHGVHLIPRHRLTSVIAGQSATFDSVHLTDAGHRRMLAIAEEVLRLDADRF